MKINRLAPVLIASMFALSLNFIGAGQAQAAACSKYDKGMWNENELNNVNYFTAMAFIGRGVLQPTTDDNMNAALDLMDKWVIKTKNKKVKAAVKKFQAEFEKGAVLYDWSSNPKLTDAQRTLASMFKLNRC